MTKGQSRLTGETIARKRIEDRLRTQFRATKAARWYDSVTRVFRLKIAAVN
ncbi:MAG: hypothetical protein ACRDVC_07095 [Acidimicrobiales bacterium]